MNSKDRHLEKAKAIAELGVGQYGKHYVEEIGVERGLLKIRVRGIDNNYYFQNPPILVDDENGDILVKDKEEKVVRKLKEDPKQAITESLAHTISTQK